MFKMVKVEAGMLAAFHWGEVEYQALTYLMRFISTSDVIRGHMTDTSLPYIYSTAHLRISNPIQSSRLSIKKLLLKYTL